MSFASSHPSVLPTPAERYDSRRSWVWHAPLVPVAIAWTAGIVLDRRLEVPLAASLLGVLACLTAWLITGQGRSGKLPLVYLAMAVFAMGSAYHGWRHRVFADDDVGQLAGPDPRPVHLRGVLAEEPVVQRPSGKGELLSIPHSEDLVATLRVTAVEQPTGWQPASGLARLIVTDRWPDVHLGDEVELFGRLTAPRGPANPGELDQAALLLDQGIRAVVSVRKTPAAVSQRVEGRFRSFRGCIMALRGWAGGILTRSLPGQTSGLARALVLGDTSEMTSADWDRYKETGVVHVLAISGFHLVVLAVVLWWVFRLLGVRRRHAAGVVIAVVLIYAVLTGGRPPIVRAAVTVVAGCGALFLRRPVVTANTVALAWLTVTMLNPADLAEAGCLLSFLAVVVLSWGPWHWFPRERDPLDVLREECLPAWRRALLWLSRRVGFLYLLTWTVWLSAAPLVASRYHLVAAAGLLLGPPIAALGCTALVAGFMLLAAAAVCPPLTGPLAGLAHSSLAGCDALVRLGARLPAGHVYLSDIPEWWLWVFYLALLLVFTVPSLRHHWRWALVAAAAWGCVGLAAMAGPRAGGEFRCTFLAVGHGGCAVLETDDGRTLLYDAGAMNGPEVTRRQIAPYLWSRGVRRIDEILLSHADLDHFNGLPDLLARFTVGQVTLTPTFADKRTRGVAVTLEALARHGVSTRIVRAGDSLLVGAVRIEVLHPPASGPEGNENARSLVLRVRHAGHTLLLTGDLEGPGLERVLRLPAPRIDVLMAPHHGSRLANTPDLCDWARPACVVACQGPPRWPNPAPDPYDVQGIPYFGTWPNGAVTIHSRPGELAVETFATRRRLSLPAVAN